MKKLKLAIIGSGPSGYTAGIYAGRAKLEPTLFAGMKPGGQLMYTTEVENFPGFKDGKNGPELMIEMQEQAKRFGTDIKNEFITAVDFSARPFKLWDSLPNGFDANRFDQLKREDYLAITSEAKKSEPAYSADAVIIATGAVSMMLGIGEANYFGRGLSTCAVCDAAFYRDRDTFVIGGGDSAMEDALALTKFANSVTIIHRRESFKASKIMQERVLNNPKIKVIWNSEVVGVFGDQKLERIKIKDQNGEKEVLADGLFLAIGHVPLSHFFADSLQVDSHGYIVTRSSWTKNGFELGQKYLSKAGLLAYPTMTSVEGVFAAGDVVDVRFKQAITAAGQGTQAALDAERWLESR